MRKGKKTFKTAIKPQFLLLFFIMINMLIWGTAALINAELAYAEAVRQGEYEYEMLQHKYDLEVQRKLSSLKTKNVEPQTEIVKDTCPENSERINCINVLAKTVYGEAKGVNSTMQKSAVIWCILNRCDKCSYKQVIKQATKPYQFDGYKSSNPTPEWAISLAQDVLDRWIAENNGEKNVGRTLPKSYKYFMGDGKKNYFCEQWHKSSLQYTKDNAWDWSLANPYED